MGLGFALSEDVRRRRRPPRDRHAEVAGDHAAGRACRDGRVRPRRGAAARGAVRGEGRRRDRPGPDGRRRWPARCTRSRADGGPAPDEGLGRRHGRRCPKLAAAACAASSGATDGDRARRAGRSSRRSTRPGRRTRNVVVDDGRVVDGRRPSGARRSDPRSTARDACDPGQRLRPHAPVLGARPRACRTGSRRPRTSCRSSSGSGGAWTAPSTRTSIRASALVGRRRRAARRHDDDHRPPRLAGRDRRLARRRSRQARWPSSALRSVLCYEVTDRDGAERATAGVEENRRFLAQDGLAARPRDGRGARLVHAVRRDARRAASRSRRTPVSGSTSTSPRTRPTSGTRRRASAPRVVRRLAARARWTGARSSPTASHVDAAEIELIGAMRGDRRPQPPLEHEQPVGRAPVAALGDAVALGHRRHRRRHVRGVAGGVLARARGGACGVGPAWPLARAGRGGARSPGAPSGSRCSAGSSRAPPPTSWSSTTTRRRRSRPTNLGGALGVRVWARHHVRDVHRGRRDGRARPAASSAWTRTRSRRSRASRRRGCGSAIGRTSRHIPSSRREARDGRARARAASACTSRTSTRCATASSYVRTPRSAGSRPSGRPRAGSSARPPCRWPRSPPRPSASRSGRAS